MPRPFALNIFSLRIIPNTQLAKDLEERKIKIPEIDADYMSGYHRTMGNALVFILCFWKNPKWLYKILRNKFSWIFKIDLFKRTILVGTMLFELLI